MLTWSEALAVASGLLSFIVLLGSALSRETVGELKRRVTTLETDGRAGQAGHSALSATVGKLEERTNGVTTTLERFESQMERIETHMVPRAEWESRHSATDGMLQRILSRLEGRDSQSQLEPPPPMPPRRR